MLITKKLQILRVPSDSKRGRQCISAKGSQFFDYSRITTEQDAWNKEVERKKQEKINRKLFRKHHGAFVDLVKKESLQGS